MSRALLRCFWIVVLSGSAARGAVEYSLTDLGTWDAIAINISGHIVGVSDYLSGRRPYLYSGGSMQGLGTLGGAFGAACGVNDADQVVGYSMLSDNNTTRAFLYSGGVMADLGTLGGAYSSAYAINNSGQIVGSADISASGPRVSHAFLYSNGAMTDLGTLGGDGGVAISINSSGDIVGSAAAPYGEVSHGFLYHNGIMHDLDTFGWGWSRATDINDRGQIVGTAARPNPNPDPNVDEFPTIAFVLSDGVLTDLGTLGGRVVEANAINNKGVIVGRSGITPWTNTPFIYRDGVMTDLATLIDAAGWHLGNAMDINDDGMIVGWGSYNGEHHAFLLTPIPEPSGIAVLGACGLAMIARCRRPGNRAVTPDQRFR